MQLPFAKRYYLGLFGMLLFSMSACQYMEKAIPKSEKQKAIAEVNNKTLYLSDLDGMVPEGTTREDSVNIVNSFIDRWVRETLLMNEAEKNIPKDLNIDKLVRDYRTSLVLYNFEKKIVESELDSVITPEELNAFYENNKDQFELEAPIARCNFVKVPKSSDGLEEFEKWWKNPTQENEERILAFSQTYAKVFLLDDKRWYKVDDIVMEFPKNTLTKDNFGSKKDYNTTEGDFKYFLKVLEHKNKKDAAPMAYVKEQAAKRILHHRKINLIEKKKLELYERERASNNIKIYTN